MLLLLVAPTGATAATVSQQTLVATAADEGTPEILDGDIQALAQDGDTIVFGGSFTQVRERGGDQDLPMTYLGAYDRRTNQLIPGFRPIPNRRVWALAAGPTPGTVYVGGAFTFIDGRRATRLALLDTTTGRPVPGFTAPTINGTVRTLVRSGDRLYIGGSFTAVGGVAHVRFAALDATTGAVDHTTDLAFTDNHNCGRVAGAKCQPVAVTRMAVNPQGTRLVAIGNFRTVNGQTHDQVAVADLVDGVARLRSQWSTSWFTAPCYSRSFDYWVRDVDFSPDGSYFVVGSTGGGNVDACDALVRFETDSEGGEPTWLASTGGDSIFSVSAGATAIYIGGHFRWMNNALGVDRPREGSVPRPGIAALDPDTGLPMVWNPGRHPRDKGVFAILATDRELILGTDNNWFGNREQYTPRLTSIPLAGGQAPRPFATASLPGTLNRVSAGSDTLDTYSVSTSGGATSASSGTLDGGSQIRGAVQLGDYLYLAMADGTLHRRSYVGGTVAGDWLLDPYNDPYWSDVLTGVRGGPTYRGLASTFHAQMPDLRSMFVIGKDLYYTVGGDDRLHRRPLEAETGITHPLDTVLSGVDLPRMSGGTWADGYLFYAAQATGDLYRQPFDGHTLGAATRIGGPSVDGVDWRSQVLFVGSAAATPPGPVTITGQSSTNRSVTVDFTAPTTLGAGTLTGYVATVEEASQSGGEPVSAELGASATSWTASDLADDTEYRLTISPRTSVALGPPAEVRVRTQIISAVTLWVSSTSLSAGSPLTVNGTVTSKSTGEPLADRTVSIYQVVDGERTMQGTPIITDADGAYRMTFIPTQTAAYQADVARSGDQPFGRSRLSPEVTVH
ncbi:MAG: hypothetical protein ACK5MT_04550 [Actinomycetales bacterium]